jgi:predicted peptidase
MPRRLLLAAFLVLIGGVCVMADEPETREFKDATGKTLPYRLIKPAKIEPGKKYPLVLLLHGAGERGTDNKAQLVWWYDAKKPSLLTHPAFVEAGCFAIAPQCPPNKKWVEVPWEKGSYKTPEISDPLRLALELTDATIKEFPIDPDRVYVTGLSMGGYGTWDALARRPELFAAAIAVCGAGDPDKAKTIAHIPVWAFHGDKDEAVPVKGSRDMIEAMKKAGATPKYSELAGVGHNSWSPAYADKDFWPWLLSQKRAKQ